MCLLGLGELDVLRRFILHDHRLFDVVLQLADDRPCGGSGYGNESEIMSVMVSVAHVQSTHPRARPM